MKTIMPFFLTQLFQLFTTNKWIAHKNYAQVFRIFFSFSYFSKIFPVNLNQTKA